MPKIKREKEEKEAPEREISLGEENRVLPEEEVPILAAEMAPRDIAVVWHPDIRQGTCEFCGVVRSDKPSWEQYKYCRHYSKLADSLKCLYCPAGTDPEEWFKGRTLKVVAKKSQPNVLYVFCDDLRCRNKFYASFRA